MKRERGGGEERKEMGRGKLEGGGETGSGTEWVSGEVQKKGRVSTTVIKLPLEMPKTPTEARSVVRPIPLRAKNPVKR